MRVTISVLSMAEMYYTVRLMIIAQLCTDTLHLRRFSFNPVFSCFTLLDRGNVTCASETLIQQ